MFHYQLSSDKYKGKVICQQIWSDLWDADDHVARGQGRKSKV